MINIHLNYIAKYSPMVKEVKEGGYIDCLEYDPIYGVLMLVLTFISGIFWSSLLFFKLWIYLTERDSAFYNRKRILFFFFMPLSLLSAATFPLQLLVISIIKVFNNQDQWNILTFKTGLVQGLFNAHFKFILQLFIICVRSDRVPSMLQYLLLFVSLILISFSRVSSLLLDRGWLRWSLGQKLWWIVRYTPGFLFNCAFKLGSIAVILAMLRFQW